MLPAAKAWAANPCKKQYKASYQTDWELSRAAWDGYCKRDRNSTLALRSAQRAFTRKCRKKFAAKVRARESTQSEVDSYCAQGTAGRALLMRMLGVEDEKKKKAPPPAKRAMGPLVEALKIARSNWMPDACLAGMSLTFYDRKKMKKKEELKYLFFSKKKWKVTYIVRYIDSSLPKFSESLKDVDDKSLCLSDVEVDLDEVLAIAGRHGLPLKARGLRWYTLSLAPGKKGVRSTWSVLSMVDHRSQCFNGVTGALIEDDQWHKGCVHFDKSRE